MSEKRERNDLGNSTGKYMDADIHIELDNEIRSFLREGIQDASMSEARKRILQQAVRSEAAGCRDGIVRRLLQRVHDFMDTTFEISLAPVVTALGVIVVGITTLSYGYIALPSEKNVSNPAGYIQQTSVNPDGSTRILFKPADWRG